MADGWLLPRTEVEAEQGQLLEALRNVPLSRSVKLGGTSRIVLGAAQLGILGDVLDAIRSYQRS